MYHKIKIIYQTSTNKTVDWRDRGVISPVYDQGVNGSSMVYAVLGGCVGVWMCWCVGVWVC